MGLTDGGRSSISQEANGNMGSDIMDLIIAGVLAVDGVTNGAIYALLGIAIVLIFSVTRVLFIAQGEFVAFGALTMAMLQQHQIPGTVWLLLVLAGGTAIAEAVTGFLRSAGVIEIATAVAKTLAYPVAISALAIWAAPQAMPMPVQALLVLGLVAPMGPLIYRLAFESLVDASALFLLIVSIGVHFTLVGLGLAFFGAEGFRNPPFWDARASFGAIIFTGQAGIVIAASLVLIVLLWVFFAFTIYGKAMRATAINGLGARLMAIPRTRVGRGAFAMGALFGALSGLLIGPTTTMFYDSGFLIGLKGFVAAIIGGLASYPAVAIGALLIGLVESFGAFWASAFKEVIVFTLIVPVLLWRSMRQPHEESSN